MNRLGVILIISGFLLLGYREFFSAEVFRYLFEQCLTNWPVLLIVIGFMMAMPKKKRKSHR